MTSQLSNSSVTASVWRMDFSPDLRTVPLPDGSHLAYVDATLDTPTSRPPLVFLHGGALDHRMWSGQIATFGADHRVVAVDARGHGWSSTPTGPFRHCDDLAHLLRHLNLDPAVLVGVSLGGGTAVDTALEYPDLVSHLVVSGTGTSETDFTDPWVLAVFDDWATAQAEQNAAAWLDAFMRFVSGPSRSLADVDDAVVARVREMVVHTLATHVPDGEPVLPTPVTGTWKRAEQIDIPVLAVPGLADSPDHIRRAGRLAEVVPDGRVVPIEDTAHYPNMERPTAFGAALRSFFDDRS